MAVRLADADLLIHPDLYYLFDLKTPDAFIPTVPERLMGPLNMNRDIASEFKQFYRNDPSHLE